MSGGSSQLTVQNFNQAYMPTFYDNKLVYFPQNVTYAYSFAEAGAVDYDGAFDNKKVVDYSWNCPGSLVVNGVVSKDIKFMSTVIGEIGENNFTEEMSKLITQSLGYQTINAIVLKPIFTYEDKLGIGLKVSATFSDWILLQDPVTLTPTSAAITAASQLPNFTSIKDEIYNTTNNTNKFKDWYNFMLNSKESLNNASPYINVDGATLWDLYMVNYVGHSTYVCLLLGLDPSQIEVAPGIMLANVDISVGLPRIPYILGQFAQLYPPPSTP